MKPFHGLTFCPTGIQDEELSKSLSKQIIKLGGLFSKDLTKQVNVLVVGKTHHTAKYNFTVQNRPDIIYIHYTAIVQLYDLWLHGEDITYPTHSQFSRWSTDQKFRMLMVLQKKFPFKHFMNYYIFIGRITSNPNIVPDLVSICESQNAFKCNPSHFVKDCAINYPDKEIIFITDTDRGARVMAAKDQNIPIVHYKWLLDCNKRNAALQYDPYYLVQNLTDTDYNDIGKRACNCWKYFSSEENTALQEDIGPSSTTVPAFINKYKQQGDRIWNGILSKKSASSTKTASNNTASQENITSLAGPTDKLAIFHNCKFYIHPAFTDTQFNILQKIITQNDGHILDTTTCITRDTNTFCIVPSNIPLSEIDVPQSNLHLATDFFIERCLHYKKLLLPLDTWSKPFWFTRGFKIIPKPTLSHDSETINVSITGFQGVELLHLTKILQMLQPMGIHFNEYLNKSTNILIINLASLSSVPKTHELWHNEYADLFTSQYGKTTNQVFRNSMKRKIEFVKEVHSIPVVTPAFIINLLHEASILKPQESKTVLINTTSWCIICPRGKKDAYSCQIVSAAITNPSHISSSSPMKLSNGIRTPSIKETRLEFLQMVNNANSKQAMSNDVKKSHFLDEEISSAPLPTKVLDIKRQRIASEQQFPAKIERTSSWGKMMSAEILKHSKEEYTTSFLQDLEPEVNDAVAYTQVTYGTASEIKSANSGRRLTRKSMKEMGN